MFKFSKDESFYEKILQEEYERQQQANLTRGIGNFLYRYIVYSLIWLSSALVIYMVLIAFFEITTVPATFLGLIMALFIFKLQYIKDYPIKSLVTICFIFCLVILAFYGDFLRNIYPQKK